MKLATIRRIAHHTRGEARPLIPVQENALSGSATSVAPRFKRNSDTSTQTTLKPSCSHGLPKPEGICFFVMSFVMWSEVETSLTFSGRTEEAKSKESEIPPLQLE